MLEPSGSERLSHLDPNAWAIWIRKRVRVLCFFWQAGASTAKKERSCLGFSDSEKRGQAPAIKG
eukprot:1179817-Pleurochrysis_carterae.AAC.1